MADIKIVDRGLMKIIKKRSAMSGRGVKFGIQSDAGSEDGTTILDIAIWNEYGTEKKTGEEHIPARPFMRDFYEKNQKPMSMMMDLMVSKVDNGMNVETALDLLGNWAESHQKAHVQPSKSWAKANADITVKRKKSDKPLIDHGLMVNAIRYVKT